MAQSAAECVRARDEGMGSKKTAARSRVGSTTARLDEDEPLGSRIAARPRSERTSSTGASSGRRRSEERDGYTSRGSNFFLIPAPNQKNHSLSKTNIGIREYIYVILLILDLDRPAQAEAGATQEVPAVIAVGSCVGPGPQWAPPRLGYGQKLGGCRNGAAKQAVTNMSPCALSVSTETFLTANYPPLALSCFSTGARLGTALTQRPGALGPSPNPAYL
jgi:hypothetical protein